MICLDTDAVICGYQLAPLPEIAVYRRRLRAFILENGERFMVPAVAFSEYQFRFEGAERAAQVAELTERHVHVPEFDRHTALMAADLGRKFVADHPDRTLAAVARANGSDRYCLKADLLIVATALQHDAAHFITRDGLAYKIAQFAKLNAHRLQDLPEPRPPTRIPPPPPARGSARQPDLFGEESDD